MRDVQPLIDNDDDELQLNAFGLYAIWQSLRQFETVFSAEMDVGVVFLVTPKRGYNIRDLVFAGEILFPLDLQLKAKESVEDLRAAGKCIAFELPTAAAFHLHRANEAVLRKYWDVVTNNAPPPKQRNIGDYLAELNTKNLGDPKVKAALRDLKDMHRNPVLHPDETLDSIDEAIALLNQIHSVIVHMLKAIP